MKRTLRYFYLLKGLVVAQGERLDYPNYHRKTLSLKENKGGIDQVRIEKMFQIFKRKIGHQRSDNHTPWDGKAYVQGILQWRWGNDSFPWEFTNENDECPVPQEDFPVREIRGRLQGLST